MSAFRCRYWIVPFSAWWLTPVHHGANMIFMQTVRATITFPYDLHQELRQEAFRRRTSLSKVLIDKVRPVAKRKLSMEEQLKKDFALFDKVGKSGLQIDAVKAVREDRNRDDA